MNAPKLCNNYLPMPLTFLISSTSGDLCEHGSADLKVCFSCWRKSSSYDSARKHCVKWQVTPGCCAALCAINGFSLNSCREEATLMWHFREHYAMCSLYSFRDTKAFYFTLLFFRFSGSCYTLLCIWIGQSLYRWNHTWVTAVVLWYVLFIFKRDIAA